ncbi:hypothetical protein [Streptomyces sp. M92]|nr:hypothetical protein [Streptomyces sp. M92]
MSAVRRFAGPGVFRSSGDDEDGAFTPGSWQDVRPAVAGQPNGG